MSTTTAYLTTCLLAMSATLQALIPQPSYEPQDLKLALSIEYLFWKVQEEQLYPVILAKQTTANGLNTSDIDIKNQTFDYTSGFRAGIGYHLPCIPYNLKLAYTRIHPRTEANYSVSDPKDLIAIAFADQTNSDAPHAKCVVSDWHLNYDMLDLYLSHQFTIACNFTLSPHIGVKGGWIKQTQTMEVKGILLGQNPVQGTTRGSVERQNNFKGIGPLMGADLQLAFSSQLGVFATLNAALPLGKFDLKTETYLSKTSNNSETNPQQTTITNSHHFLSPTLQMLIGGDWNRCLFQKYWIRFGVAYEVQFWLNQMRTNNSIPQALFVNSPSGGDLIMHGLTVQANLDF